MFSFQNLQIYQLAKDIVKFNYRLTKKFPSEEKYALIQQMNRAVVSVPSNIAEGTSRKSNKDKAHFVNIAYGSLMELVCQMEIALELGYIEESEYDEFIIMVKNLSVKMSNYLRTIV
ncbi:four helix bundle protein [Serpentinicella sp. ANB-PHB4]|uniref:four helix bundle protein n=1 Tax=Serpentinicella sp. ANB-PHB4 TaxID=3074076 RepID=UPI00285E0A7B|nr:four helix bundle protein [Serpentinicella sp. ANB-PHB4]MDR5658770.1 four helix bundle protein [Serpentinicella sp. ANB-PHB4]